VRCFDVFSAVHFRGQEDYRRGRTIVVGLKNYISIYTYRPSAIFPSPFGMSRALLATHYHAHLLSQEVTR
jgi:hypothetical protein